MRVYNQAAFHSVLKKASVLGLIITLSACSTYYIPNTQNVSLFEEKKELQVYGGLALGDASIGGDLQAAYSITDHFAVAGSGYYGSVDGGETNAINSVFSEGQNNFGKVELSAGYFTDLGQSNGIFEIYGGWGSGGFVSNNQFIRDDYSFNQYFVQPNIGSHLGRMDIAFSTRVSYAIWEGFKQVYIEPALTLRAGGERAKFQFQILGSLSDDKISGSDVYYSRLGTWEEVIHMSFGIFVPIDLNKHK